MRQLLRGEDGQAMVEYGLIAAALLIGLAVAIKGMQLALNNSLQAQERAAANAP